MNHPAVPAAHAYLLAVFNGSDGELGIRRCRCDSRQSELLMEARAVRAELAKVKTMIRAYGLARADAGITP
ncbi:hypothetical protein [Micromonospora sp. KC721]|uniref:hypothetical protein n=1 Tax=Micromonospora sp. KC721 TaxID=2530380 RepID=UPI00104EB80D|nr:hypothetical protein [Micromonospora sp. KC721]TDB69733.1 hypothetical protein E1182_29145 [Micromonospora sp. KC721]